jgi:hypothetical protein
MNLLESLLNLDETTHELQLFVVFAYNGRASGSAVVKAKNKSDANMFMKNSDWLEQGRIDKKETLSTQEAINNEILEPEEVEKYMASLPNEGSWEEIEWGT